MRNHPEYLDTPRLVADDTQKTVWKWEQQEPFGASAANDDPGGNSVAFEFNLRFPGQYFDKESNTHYNYFRDYDPAIGRYAQSDLLGLQAGLNTYSYAFSNSLKWTDSVGLEVTIWSRPVDIGPRVNGQGILGLLPGADHWWIKTDKYEAGMGPWNGSVPGQEGRSDAPLDPTETVDHTGQSLAPNARRHALPFPVDEECINKCIKPGRATGLWTHRNQCKTFVDDCLDRCRRRIPFDSCTSWYNCK